MCAYLSAPLVLSNRHFVVRLNRISMLFIYAISVLNGILMPSASVPLIHDTKGAAYSTDEHATPDPRRQEATRTHNGSARLFGLKYYVTQATRIHNASARLFGLNSHVTQVMPREVVAAKRRNSAPPHAACNPRHHAHRPIGMPTLLF